jgi:hypothetical protein
VQASGRPLILGNATKTAVVDTRPRRSSFVLFADFIEARGCDFYRLVCARDLDGMAVLGILDLDPRRRRDVETVRGGHRVVSLVGLSDF